MPFRRRRRATATSLLPTGGQPGSVASAAATSTPARSGNLRLRPQLVVLALVTMLVPVHRYALAVLPLKAADPFRVVLFTTAVLLLATLAVDPHRMPWAPMRWGKVFLGLAAASLFSDAANMAFIGGSALQGGVLNAYGKLLCYVVAMVVVRQLVRSLRDIHALLGALVVGGAVAAVGAAYERAAQDNVFKHLNDYLPLTVTYTERIAPAREGALRAMGSAEHPIAFAALLMLLVPIGAYLVSRAEWPSTNPAWRWLYACSTGLLLLGVACTTSRTGVVMAIAMAAMAAVLRPAAVRKAVPLVVAAVLVVNVIVLPGAFSSLLGAFSPEGGLVAEQTGAAGTTAGGRLGDLPTVAADVAARPLTGVGFGTRVVVGPKTNALILDNEYLGRLVESGIPGLLAVIVLVVTPAMVMWRLARRSERTSRSDLAAALACSFGAFGLSLLTFDAMSFTQVTLVWSMLLGVAIAISDVARDAVPAVGGRAARSVVDLRDVAPAGP